MAKKRISMRKLREVLRLKQECWLSNRQIASSCRIAHSVVGRYLKRAEAAGINWATAKQMDDTELERKLFNPSGKQITGITPDWVYIHQELRKKNVTLTLLHQEYKEVYTDGYEYSWFNELYNKEKKKFNVCMRQSHKAGEKLFVDYCDCIPIIDRDTGELTSTELFAGVWGASNYTYAEASRSQNKQDWVMSHVRAFEYYGCAPRAVVPDNLASGVTNSCRYEPEINRSYLEMTEYYGIAAMPARVGKPRDKAKVEAGVLVAQRWILASLRNRKFYSLSELNAAIRELLEKLNSRKMQKFKKSRREMFEELDKLAALPLPARRYEYSIWKTCRVNIDYHIDIECHYYSVPFQIAREEVDVRYTGSTVEVLYKNKRIVSHVRSYKKWGYTTLPEHMPESHRKHLEWTPSRIIKWAGNAGPNTKAVIENILGRFRFPEQGYRQCLGIKRLGDRYSPERVEAACRRAVKYRTFSYRSIKAILDNGLDKQLDDEKSVTGKVSPRHKNIRGRDYYTGTETQQTLFDGGR